MKDHSQEKELIKRMLSGELSRQEQHQVSLMMNEPWFNQLFLEMLDEQGGELEMNNDEFAQTFAGKKLAQFYEQLPGQENVKEIPEETQVVPFRKTLWKRVLPYAAAVAVAAGTLVFWLSGREATQPSTVAQKVDSNGGYPIPLEDTIQYTAHYNPKKRRVKLKLEDGSVVTLGGRSRIRYASGFSGTKRDIYLDGEAYFEVAKDARKPFTVYTGDIHTQVLGTSFKVSAFPKLPVEVSVVTGKVRVSYHGGYAANDLATMTPGDQISWANDHLTKLRIDPKDVLAWKNGMMVFKKQTLKNILDDFQQHYGVKITVINKGFLTEKISLTLDERMPLEKAMNVLAVTAGFEHSIDSLSRTVIIK